MMGARGVGRMAAGGRGRRMERFAGLEKGGTLTFEEKNYRGCINRGLGPVP